MQFSKVSARRSRVCVPALLAFLLTSLSSLSAQTAFASLCEPLTAPETVPEQRCSDGSESCSTANLVQLWPISTTPGEYTIRPATPIATERDSTEYDGSTRPNASFGHELFMDVAVPGNEMQTHTQGSYLISVYSAGIQVWDIGENPESPRRIVFKDIEQDHWLHTFEERGEFKEYLNGVDALQVGHEIFIAVVGKEQNAGFALWKFDTQAQALEPLYQDLSAASDGGHVKLVQAGSAGRIYAIAGELRGARVYDATAADQASPCLETADDVNECNVFRGLIGGPIEAAMHLDAIVKDGQIYVAVADASMTQSVNLEIWRLGDPGSPGTSTFNRKLFDGLSEVVDTVQLFSYSGEFYLAVVEDDQMKIFSATHCLDSDGCSSLGTPLVQEDLRWRNPPPGFSEWASPWYHYLTFSFSDGTPFLHYGFLYAADIWGSGWEKIWDLTPLGSATGTPITLPELTDAGGSYTDPCNGEQVDYLGDYYRGNAHGLNRYIPLRAIFNGPYLYRASNTVLDIHVRGGAGSTTDPTVSTSVSSSGIDGGTSAFWLYDPILLQATASSCEPLLGQWCWDPGLPSNTDVVATAPSLLTRCIHSDEESFTFSCEASGRCPDTTASVTAWNLGCGLEDDGLQLTSSFTLKDPAVAVLAADSGGTTFPQCSTVALSADLGGRGPVSWQWSVNNQEIEGCSGEETTAADLSQLTSVACNWDTTDVVPSTALFSDQFESGTCSNWNAGTSGSCAKTWSPPATDGTSSFGFLGKAGSIEVDVELVVRYEGSVVDSYLLPTINIEEVGDPAFADPLNPLLAPVVSGSTATLEAPATDTTLWSWEIEDPAGSSSCNFGSGTTTCAIVATTSDSVSHTWGGAGTYDYRVSLSNCVSSGTASASGTVTVEEATEPVVQGFTVDFNDPNCAHKIGGEKECRRSCVVSFYVTVEEAGNYDFFFDWDTPLNGTPTYSNTAQKPVSQPTSTTYFFEQAIPDTDFADPWVLVSNGLDTEKEFGGFITVVDGACE